MRTKEQHTAAVRAYMARSGGAWLTPIQIEREMEIGASGPTPLARDIADALRALVAAGEVERAPTGWGYPRPKMKYRWLPPR